MRVEQLYTGCLGEAAYYVESKGEAAIIDPLRETEPYIGRAARDGAAIKYVLETHFHADFVSGHLDLAKKTGATIVYGPTAKPNFEALVAEDGQVLELGDVTIKVLHTPGHTMESTTFLLIDEDGNNHAIFTGDTLFIGDVGRPDLAVASDLTRDDLAAYLFDSLRSKIMPLEDDTIVYPGHGAGSACGKKMSEETHASLGSQKRSNYALREDMTKAEFIEEVTAGLMPPPQYFPKNAALNRMGYESVDIAMAQGTTTLSVEEFESVADARGALILDTRSRDRVPGGSIPGSIFIGLDGDFAPWVGALITDLQQPILFVCDEGRESEVVRRLARVGYDNALGYLDGGFEAWEAAGRDITTIEEVSADAFVAGHTNPGLTVLDVRKKSEYDTQHVAGVENLSLDVINQSMATFVHDTTYWLYCQSGYRSLIMATILKARGFANVVSVRGGFDALSQTSLRFTQLVEQQTML